MDVLRKELYALKLKKKCIQNLKNIKNFILSFFINQDEKKCSNYFNSSVL